MFSEVSQNSQENTWARASFLIKLQAKALRSWSWEIHLTRGWFAQCDWWWQEEIYGRAYQWINQEIWRIRPGNKKREPRQDGTILDGICRHVASLPRIFKKHQNRRSGFVDILLTANDSIILLSIIKTTYAGWPCITTSYLNLRIPIPTFNF